MEDYTIDGFDIRTFIVQSDLIEGIRYSDAYLNESLEKQEGYPYQHVSAFLSAYSVPSEFNLLRAHKILLPQIEEYPYRKVEVMIGGRYGLSSELVEGAMKDLFKLQIKTVKDACWWHIEYETIHPFRDGNGRTGRMLLCSHMGSLRSEDIGPGPITIPAGRRFDYYSFIENKDPTAFEEFLEDIKDEASD